MRTENLLRRARDLLEQTFGDRLAGVVLYGSEARGNAEPESDVDLFVLLRGPVDLHRDLRRTVEALYDLQLEVGRPLHALPVDVETYEAGEYAVYRSARQEGVSA